MSLERTLVNSGEGGGSGMAAIRKIRLPPFTRRVTKFLFSLSMRLTSSVVIWAYLPPLASVSFRLREYAGAHGTGPGGRDRDRDGRACGCQALWRRQAQAVASAHVQLSTGSLLLPGRVRWKAILRARDRHRHEKYARGAVVKGRPGSPVFFWLPCRLVC